MVGLLRSAGLAVKALTASDSIEIKGQKDSFAAVASSYFAILSSLDAQLRRQILALEEASILTSEATSKHGQGKQLSSPDRPSLGGRSTILLPKSSGKGTIIGGGLGSLDIGWLNSRNNHTGQHREMELLEEAQRLVETGEQKESGKALD